MHVSLFACAFVGSVAVAATTIPPNLAARADQLQRDASPQVLAWVGEQARALAKGRGPVDVAALQTAARSRFGKTQTVSGKSTAPTGTTQYGTPGGLDDGDIMALAFLVMMEAAKSAREDLKAIMDVTKAINSRKSELRAVMSSVRKTTPTPTPAPDRTEQLVAEARKLVDRTRGAELSRVAPR